MALYLDTEFNGHGGELISIGMVSSVTRRILYGVLPLPARLHPWIAAHVVPMLGQEPEEPEMLRLRVKHFLEFHRAEDIYADWPDDFAHLMRLMSGPEYELSYILPCVMHLIVSENVQSERQHNALSDAEALMRWCNAVRTGRPMAPPW